MKQLQYLFLSLSLLVVCGCGHENKQLIEDAPMVTESYTDGLGRTINMKKAPETVISLAPNITEMIYVMDAQDKLIARSQACNYPPEVLDKPVVQTYPELDLEALVTYDPELVLATDEIISAEIIPLLDKFNLKSYFQTYSKLDDIYSNMLKLGEILGKKEKATYIVDSLRAIDAKITAATENEIQYRTLVLIGTDPILVAGHGSFMNELITKAGGKNVFENLAEKYAEVTPEDLLAAQPEYIILPARDQQHYADLVSRFPALMNTPAQAAGQVYLVDPDLILRAGPRTVEGLAQLTRILHSKINVSAFFE